jgi:hypothetical protein
MTLYIGHDSDGPSTVDVKIGNVITTGTMSLSRNEGLEVGSDDVDRSLQGLLSPDGWLV